MATSALSLFKANDPYEQLISNIIQIEREPQLALKNEQRQQERMKAVLSDADSKLSALNTILKQFLDPLSSPFSARTAAVPSDAAFAVSVSDRTAFGAHSIEIERLARADTRVTQQFDRSGTSLRSFFASNGAQTFTIGVAHPTQEDPAHRVNVQVTVDPEGQTDEDILKEISRAINDAIAAAVDEGSLSGGSRPAASVVNETSSLTRLSLRSGATGYTHRLDFTDSAGGLLSFLDINGGEVLSGGGGGQVTAVGASETDSLLNAKFTLNGITLYRDANQVHDALDGATITLKRATSEAGSFSVDTDVSAIRDEINGFITKYNDILTFIAGKSTIDGQNDVRGDFAGDSAFRGLRFDMRNDMVRGVGGLPSGAATSLREVGITINNDGTLSLTDEDKLLAAIRNDASSFEKLFKGADGYATRLKSHVDRFLGVNGLIDRREEVIDNRINRLKARITDWDGRLERRENQLRQEFARMQEAIAAFQNQQLAFFQFFGY